MVPALRMIAILLAWNTIFDCISIVRVAGAGVEEGYALTYFFTASFALAMQVAVIVLLLAQPRQLLRWIGFSDSPDALTRDNQVILAASAALALYMFIEGSAFAITATASAHAEFKDLGIVFGSIFTTDVFEWNWQDALYGCIQAAISAAVFIAIVFYNKAKQAGTP